MSEPPDLHATTDAQVWAREWCRVARIKLEEYGEGLDEIVEEGWMITWFANAIEVGRDAGAKPLRDEISDRANVEADLRAQLAEEKQRNATRPLTPYGPLSGPP